MARAPLLLLTLLGAVTAGCTLPPPKDFLGYLDLHSGRAPTRDQFQVTASGLVSPSLQLSREQSSLRGLAPGGGVIEMRVEGDTIKGSKNSMPVEMHVSREGNAIVARGMYGGQLADLAICAPASDAAAPAGQVQSIQGPRPCLRDSPATVTAMVKELGDGLAMAMLVAAYYR